MPPVRAAQSSSSAQQILLGSVWVVETCLINSAIGEVLTSSQTFPAQIELVYVRAFAVERDLQWSQWLTLCSLLV